MVTSVEWHGRSLALYKQALAGVSGVWSDAAEVLNAFLTLRGDTSSKTSFQLTPDSKKQTVNSNKQTAVPSKE